MERTLVLLKPDAVQRALVGEIVSRLERKGLRFAAMKLMRVSEELAHRHYGEHEGKPFFGELVSFITSGPVLAMIVEGENAVALVRSLMGATNPVEASPGTVRGDLGIAIGMNLIHALTQVSQRPERRRCFSVTARRWITSATSTGGSQKPDHLDSTRPRALDVIVLALIRAEQVDDEIAVVLEHPA